MNVPYTLIIIHSVMYLLLLISIELNWRGGEGTHTQIETYKYFMYDCIHFGKLHETNRICIA